MCYKRLHEKELTSDNSLAALVTALKASLCVCEQERERERERGRERDEHVIVSHCSRSHRDSVSETLNLRHSKSIWFDNRRGQSTR